MAIISDTHNFLFIMNPRTGCSALGDLLVRKADGYYIPEEDTLNENGKLLIKKKHTTINELVEFNVISQSKLDSLLKFTTIRNPYDSLVSLWTKKKYKYSMKKRLDPESVVNKIPGFDKDINFIQNHNFSEWIIQMFSKRPAPFINARHTKGVDIILRFENLQEDFNKKILSRFGISESLTIPSKNVTKNRSNDYKEYYTKEAIDVVFEKLKDEILEFGYEF